MKERKVQRKKYLNQHIKFVLSSFLILLFLDNPNRYTNSETW